jgi:hypothetical protein
MAPQAARESIFPLPRVSATSIAAMPRHMRGEASVIFVVKRKKR